MERIPIYNITRLHELFSVTDLQKDYFLVLPDQYKALNQEPFRTKTYAIGLLREGSLLVHSGLEKTTFTAPALVAMGPQVIRRFENMTDQPALELIFFTDTFVTADQSNIFFLDKFSFFSQGSHVVALDDPGFKKFDAIFNLLESVLREKHIHEAAIIKSYIRIMISEVDALFKDQHDSANKERANSNPLLSNFNALLSKEFNTHRSISYYADQLAVTPKYLSEYVKQQTGQTAGEWIDKAVILEAKVLLQRPELSILQISLHLNFVDQSVFGKFFKAKTGISPKAFRSSFI